MTTGDFSSHPIPPISPEARGIKPQVPKPHSQLVHLRIAQEMHSLILQDWAEPAFSPLNMMRRFDRLENKVRTPEKGGDTEKSEKEEKIVGVRRLTEISERFYRDNPELQSRLLLLLRSRIKEGDSKDDILRKVLEAYPDFSLADEALDFLLETSEGGLRETLLAVKKDFNERYGMEIRAGRNMGAQARLFSEQGLGSPTALRDMYRDIVGNPRDAAMLFEELSKEFPYNKMKGVIEFILHSLGTDLKSKGPSISRAELHRLMSEGRSLQAILGLYQFFKARMRLINSAFSRNGLSLPARMTFEMIARIFMKFLQERYPSADKALALAEQLGISEEVLAEIIIYTQMRDAVRQIAPKLYKSEQHKNDVFMALIEALEKLEQDLEDQGREMPEEEKEEKEEEEEKND